jgi:hypothetical protein
MGIELPIGAFIAATIVLIPLPWHWRARNIATLSIIAWLFISNVVYGVNSIIWMGNTAKVALIWCDIGEETFRIWWWARTKHQISHEVASWIDHIASCLLPVSLYPSRTNRFHPELKQQLQ